MPAAKLVVIYPVPTDLEQFERRYLEHHVPMAVDRLAGKTKIVATKVLSSAQGGSAPFHRIAEIHFPSMSALQACAASEGAKETIANATPPSAFGDPGPHGHGQISQPQAIDRLQVGAARSKGHGAVEVLREAYYQSRRHAAG